MKDSSESTAIEESLSELDIFEKDLTKIPLDDNSNKNVSKNEECSQDETSKAY
ncbi:MAG: hypothetical protein K6E98_08505 [Lachnospiraceae bacterium]|nr:hypothetical protein [Lachnospiraceae bacterium]